jgi:hypothetical protein
MSIAEAAARARAATDRILAALATADRGVVVDSPPGAGKSTLVVRAAGYLAGAGPEGAGPAAGSQPGGRVMVVGQTNEQVDDLIDRMAAEYPELPIGRLSAQDYVPSERVAAHANVTARSGVADLADHPLVVATAAKWATLATTGLPSTGKSGAGNSVAGNSTAGNSAAGNSGAGRADAGIRWPWAIVDEAYQMRSDLLLRIAHLFDKALFVGDPGQLDPFSTADGERWLGLSWDPTASAVAVLLTNNDDIPVHTLPVSWRLPASAAPVMSSRGRSTRSAASPRRPGPVTGG